MDIIIGLAILFAIGWVVSKSKVLSGLLNALGLAMNWLWGSLFIGFGAWSLFTGGTEWWMALLSIGVGIYFLISPKTERKIGDAANTAAAAFVDRLTAPEEVLAEEVGPIHEDVVDEADDRASETAGPTSADDSAVLDPSSGASMFAVHGEPRPLLPELVQQRVHNVKTAYDSWLAASSNCDTFTFDDDLAVANDDLGEALDELTDACIGLPEATRLALSTQARHRLPALEGDTAFSRLLGVLDAGT